MQYVDYKARWLVCPHSLRAVTPDRLKGVVNVAQGEVIHIHIAEQTKEVQDCIAWSGQRPIEWLLENQTVDERWCLVHATHATDAEVAGMAASKAVVGLCPITEANLGDGIFPAPLFVEQGGRYGVGSDSNVLLDGAEELRILEYSQRLAQRGRNVLARAEGSRQGGACLRRRWLVGRRRSGLAGVPTAQRADMEMRARSADPAVVSSTGRAFNAAAPDATRLQTPGLKVGAFADVVSLSTDHPALAERHEDESYWIAGYLPAAAVWSIVCGAPE